MTKHTEKEYTIIRMVLYMKVTGRKINSTAMELKNGLMVPNMKVVILKARSTEQAHFYGQTGLNTLGSFSTTTFKAKGSINGLMEGNLTVSG